MLKINKKLGIALALVLVATAVTVYYTTAAADSCTYSGSGNWVVQTSDNCNITSTVNVAGKLIVNGTTGGFNIIGGSVTATDMEKTSTATKLTIFNGGKLAITT